MAETGADIRDSRIPLKEKILEAALESLRELTPAALMSAIGAREIARRAGASTASVFHHYGSMEGLAEAVLASVYDPGLSPVTKITDAIAEITRSRLPVETSLALHTSEFERITQDPDLHLRMGLWAFGGEAGRQAYGHYLRTIDERLMEYCGAMFRAWGRELRPPFDLRSFVASQVALANGSSVRHLVDEEASNVTYFARAATALSMALLRVEGDRRGLDDRLTEMNYYPLSSRSRPISESPSPSRGERTRARVLHAAAELFSARGYEETTIAHIAKLAGTSQSTVHEHFASKSGVAVALFSKQAADVIPPVADEATADSGALRAHLLEVADFVGPRSGYAAPYLAGLICHEPAFADDALLQATTRAVAISTQLPAADAEHLAILTLGAVISRVLGSPSEGPERSVESVLRLMVTGLDDHHRG